MKRKTRHLQKLYFSVHMQACSFRFKSKLSIIFGIKSELQLSFCAILAQT